LLQQTANQFFDPENSVYSLVILRDTHTIINTPPLAFVKLVKSLGGVELEV